MIKFEPGNLENMYLVKWSDDWADEMIIVGLTIMSESQLKAFRSQYEKWFDYNSALEFFCGTNEQIDYSSYTEFMKAFDIVALTDIEAHVLSNTIIYEESDGVFGQMPDLAYLTWLAEDE